MTCSQIQLTLHKTMGQMKDQDKFLVSVFTVYVAKPLKRVILKRLLSDVGDPYTIGKKKNPTWHVFYPRHKQKTCFPPGYLISQFHHQTQALYETGQWHKEVVGCSGIICGIPGQFIKGAHYHIGGKERACICEGATLKVAVSNKPISSMWL